MFQAELIASHRSFISKCEVMELTNNLGNRDDTLMLYLFTDYMEICKVRKSRAFNTAKSPTGNKTYKHIQLIPLSAILCVYDIKDSPRAFAISINDELYSFNINDEVEKICYLKSLCKQLAENACRADAVGVKQRAMQCCICYAIINNDLLILLSFAGTILTHVRVT